MSYKGWTVLVDRLELDTKQYSVYHFRHDDGERRWAFNWGKASAHWLGGQWNVELNYGAVGIKIRSKLKGGYSWVSKSEPAPYMNDELLRNAGIISSTTTAPTPAPATPVVTSHLDKFVKELNQITADLGEGVTPEVLAAYANLRAEMERLRGEMTQAEGRMDMLGAMIKHRFEGSTS